MINSLALKHFRKHIEARFDFTTGLNVLRGANEKGKSTLLEGISYALFGADSLRDTFSNTVTWGSKESALRSEVVLTLDSVVYTFSRSKNGAECETSDGRKVVGQREVSAFAAQVLGVDAKAASVLMLASQGALRGALEAGPTAVSALIAKLADFDLIDRLVAEAERTLPTGNEKLAIERVARAEAALAEAQAAKPAGVQPDLWRLTHERLVEQLSVLQTEIQTYAKLCAKRGGEHQAEMQVQSEAHAAAQLAVTQVQTALQAREAQARHVADARLALDQARTAAAEAQTALAAQPAVAQVEIDAAQAEITQARGVANLVKAHTAVAALPPYPATFWEGTAEDLARAKADAQSRSATHAEREKACAATARAEEKRRITSKVCPTCGQDTLTDTHVAEHNSKVDAAVAEAQQGVAVAAEACRKAQRELTALGAVQTAAEPFVRLATALAGRDFPVSVDSTVHPPRVTWTGAAPQALDLPKAEQVLAALQQRAALRQRAEGRLEATTATVQAAQEKVRAEVERQAALPEPDLAPPQAALDAVVKTMTTLSEAWALESQEMNNKCDLLSAQEQTLKGEVSEALTEFRLAEQALASAAARVEQAEKTLAQDKEELANMAFNNALLAKLKPLKAKVTDMLWSTVLSAVSVYAEQLRGEPSKVTKGPRGFLLNDHPVESYSGSALDVTALAVRVALTKTFMPGVGLLVLDEPCAAADDSRTTNMLGFIASTGFRQVLMASHDSVSESVADNVVTL